MPIAHKRPQAQLFAEKAGDTARSYTKYRQVASRESFCTYTPVFRKRWTQGTLRRNTQRALCYLCKRQLAMAEFKATSEIWCIGIVDTRRRQGNVRYSTKRSGRVSWRRKHRLCRAKVQQPKHMHRSIPAYTSAPFRDDTGRQSYPRHMHVQFPHKFALSRFAKSAECTASRFTELVIVSDRSLYGADRRSRSRSCAQRVRQRSMIELSMSLHS